MAVEDVRAKTQRSKEMLRLARSYATKAASMPEDDPQRKILEEEAQRLIEEAKSLTDEAKQEASRYKKG